MKKVIPANAGVTGNPLKTLLQLKAFGVSVKIILIVGIAIVPFKIFGQAPVLSYSSPQTFTAGKAISTLTPTNSGGAVAAPGTYGSPKILVTPNSNQGLNGIAIDATGNAYYALTSTGGSAIYKLTPGSTTPVFVKGSTGNSSVYGLAFDPSGNLFMTEAGTNALEEIYAGFQSSSVIANGFNNPYGVACDASGNIYIADTDNNVIKRIAAGSGTVSVFSTAVPGPLGIVIDASGNIYVSSGSNNYITEFKTDGSTVNLGSGLQYAWGLAVDKAGNIFVCDLLNDAIKEFPVGGTAFVSLGSGYKAPRYIAVDASDNIYFSMPAGGNLQYVPRFNGYTVSPALPPGLTLNANTGAITGTPTTASSATSYTITAANNSGSFSTNITITVNPPPPTFSYTTPDVFYKGVYIKTLSPAASTPAGSLGYANTAASVGSGFAGPNAIATDGNGNVYVADYTGNAIKELSGGTGSPVILGSGFNHPTGIALDKAGNIYVSDSGNGAVKKMPPGGGTPTTFATGFTVPYGLAVDTAGHVFVSDTVKNTVTEISPSGITKTTIGSGFSRPKGLALDGAGNLYVADYGNNVIKEVPAAGGNPISIGTGLSGPSGIASDAAGNLFIADYKNHAVKFIPLGGVASVIGSGFMGPTAVALSPTGAIYVADYTKATVYQINPTGGYYMTPAPPVGLSFDSGTGNLSGAPSTTQTATQYTVTGYNISGAGTAGLSISVLLPPTISYKTPQSYSPNVAISPLAPTSVNVAGKAYSTSFVQGSTKKLPTTPTVIARDGSGNLYVGEGNESYINLIPRGGAGGTTVTTGIISPSGIAVDGSGNIYVSSVSANGVVKINVKAGTKTSVGTGLNGPAGMACDKAGNIYVADYNSGSLKVISSTGTKTATIATGFTHPISVALDALNNAYVVDKGNNVVKKVEAGTHIITTIAKGLNAPNSVTVDASGNIFICDSGNNLIKAIAAGSTIISNGPAITNPIGVVVDASGNIDVTGTSSFYVQQLNPTGGYYINNPLPAGLSFNNGTGVISGTPTTVTPATSYSVTAYGNGTSASTYVSIAVAVSTNALLSKLVTNDGALTTVSGPDYKDYTLTVLSATSSIAITPTTQDAAATVIVNGTAVTSGTASASIPLVAGNTVINTVVTAQDGVTTNTYSITVTRTVSSALLTKLTTNDGTLKTVTGPDYRDYTLQVSNATSSITITPTAQDSLATVTVNGATVKSGSPSAGISLPVGNTIINTIVTSADGNTKNTYSITVTRVSNDALLTKYTTNAGQQTTVTGPDYRDYTLSVPNATNSIVITPTTESPVATVTINGTTVTSGKSSTAILLAVGTTSISTVVTAQDGTTTKSYVLVVTRAAAAAAMDALYEPVTADGITIHPGVSPNNDGINDIFTIDGLTAYPDNKITIVNRGGKVIYEISSYDNKTRFFDGHSNKTGTLQLPGTYFYTLSYTADGKQKHKTGYIILKY